MKTIIYFSMGLLALNTAFSAPITFSVDPASPAVNPVGSQSLTPDDVLASGPVVVLQGSSLGLQDDFFGGSFANLDALSYGVDFVQRQLRSVPVYFSVDRVAVGISGTPVYVDASPGVASAAGNVYRALPPYSDNVRVVNGTSLGLTPGFFGDDLDALAFGLPGGHVYFSIDALSANDFVQPVANVIFIDGTGIFATGDSMGLAAEDDLDALALWDRGTIGKLDPGIDLALFSISTFSPNAITMGGQYSPADILFTDFTGGFSVWAGANDIGLGTYDELNALATRAPDGGGMSLLAISLAMLALCQYWLRRRACA